MVTGQINALRWKQVMVLIYAAWPLPQGTVLRDSTAWIRLD